MYLHGDGGSSIFQTDLLDKKIVMEKRIPSKSKLKKKNCEIYLKNEVLQMSY